MEISSSDSRSLRRPSRKMAWSSASSTRICCFVFECFTVNLENLAANTVRGPQLCRINQQVEGNRGLVPVPFCKAAHEVHEVCALDAEGAEVGYGLAQVGSFVLDRLLKVGEGVNGLFRSSSRDLAAEYVQLDFDAEKGLENAVVEVAGNAAALGLDRARA